jgi:hypothetical protein
MRQDLPEVGARGEHMKDGTRHFNILASQVCYLILAAEGKTEEHVQRLGLATVQSR